MKTHNFIKTLFFIFFSTSISAQEDSSFLKNLKIGGSADLFFKSDFDKQASNTKTSFTVPNNSFEIGMFSLKISHSSGKFTTTADIGVGNRAEQFNYTQSNTKLLIKQLYIDYAASDKFTITAGSWSTHIGYELLDAADNDIYSMSYAFSYGPFFHTGVKANYLIGKFNIMAGFANPTDLKSSFDQSGINYDNKFFIWQLGYTGDALSAYINGQQGSYNPLSSNISQFDLTASYKFTPKFKLGVNATNATFSSDVPNIDSQKWASLVGYLKYDITDTFALNYRAEYLDNKDNVLALGATNGNTVLANTISATLKHGNFQLKPELRFENSSEDIYLDKDGLPKAVGTNLMIGAAYKF